MTHVPTRGLTRARPRLQLVLKYLYCNTPWPDSHCLERCRAGSRSEDTTDSDPLTAGGAMASIGDPLGTPGVQVQR
jgi:hypothetical protein